MLSSFCSLAAFPSFWLLKDSPDEVGDQGEEHDQESGNPDQESGG